MTAEGVGHGERKAEVLAYLEAEGRLSTEDLAKRCGTSRSNVRNVAARLRRDSAIETHGGTPDKRGEPQQSEYEATDRGLRWLNHRREQAE